MPCKCSVEWCDRPHHGNGYCRRHNMQIYQYGTIKSRTTRDPNNFIIEGSLCKIECYDMKGGIKGYILIDTKNVGKCKPYKWGISADGYGSSKVGKLHNFLFGLNVDHKNRIKLDCREENIRFCTHKQNMANVGPKSNNTSGYKGVTFDKGHNKWKAQIKINGKNKSLGLFTNPVLAAITYNKAAKEFHG